MTNTRQGLAPRADTAPSVTPYLGLRARLSQVWVNRWTVLLLLVLIRVVLLIAQLASNTGDAKDKALAACTKVEDIGSSMASMPHYLSVGVNDIAATGIEKAVHAMVDILDLILDGVEGMILFYINFLTATYTCLLTAMIHGTLDVVGNVTEVATSGFNDIVQKAAKEIDNLSGDLESGINKLVGSIESTIIGHLTPDVPKVDFSSPVKELEDFKLNPEDFVKDVRKLNDEIPDFEQVQNMTKAAVSIPFNLVKKALNDSYGNYQFNRSVFPLARTEKLTFCSDNDTINNFFTKLYETIHKAKITFIVVLIVLALLAIIPMTMLEIYKWRRQQKYARLANENHFDSMDVVYIANHPHSASFGIKIASYFKGKRQVVARWCVAYATSPTALFVLSLAIAGFFSCFCQYLLLKAVQKEVPAIATEVGDFAGEVVNKLQNVSEQWAFDANHVIGGLSDDINNDVLGYVVNATDAVNNTINTFVNTMNKGLDEVFGGTILLAPIQTVLHCVIGIKLESLQGGLTWVHDHAHVTLPLFDNNTFSLGASSSLSGGSDLNTFLAAPSSGTTDEVTGAVKHVVDWLHGNIVQEALISTGLVLVYIIVVLIGVVRTLSSMATPDKSRAEGGGGVHYIVREPTEEPRPSTSHTYVASGANPFADPRQEKAQYSTGRHF